MKHVTKGVKAFRKTKDGLFTGGLGGSIETKWTIGETVTLDNDRPLELCGNGFHFFRERDACFGALLFEGETVFYTIEAYGEVLSDTEKCVCRQIKVLAPFEFVVDGDGNSGYRNSGDWNSGDWNSGDGNSGNGNSGYRNSGDWNSGDWNSGYLNSDTPETIRVFNKDCSLHLWESAQKPKFLYFSINDGESYKDAFRRSWENATENDRALVERLPNFDWNIFTEISGIEKPD